MRQLPLYTAVPVATLLAALLLPGCDAPETPIEAKPAPAARETIPPVATPALAPAPAPEPKQDKAQPSAEQRTAKSLKLTIDNDSYTGQPADPFGNVPEPGWLNKGQDTGNMGEVPVTDNLLPDLFDTQADKKAVSVKGKILTDGDSDGASTTIDGAGVNIQIQTD